MASNLKLKSEWIDKETIRVSWVDVKIRERSFGSQTLLVFVALGGFFLSLSMLMSSGSLIGLPIWIGSILALIVFYSTKVKEPNSITIGKTETRHKRQIFPTNQITRFEMGSEIALLGAVATKPAIEGSVNQTIIRMWIDDSSAYDLSKNNWQQQVNHEIRDALAKALDAVRNIDKQESHEAEFGKTGDFGMPEY